MWTPDKFWYLMDTQGEVNGVTGFSGQCATLAFCVQKYLYPDAEVVGAFNWSLHQLGTLYGHVFLYKNGVYFDAERASTNISPFLPLVRIPYKNKRVNPNQSPVTRTTKQRGDSLVILRHLVPGEIPRLANQYKWVCDALIK